MLFGAGADNGSDEWPAYVFFCVIVEVLLLGSLSDGEGGRCSSMGFFPFVDRLEGHQVQDDDGESLISRKQC